MPFHVDKTLNVATGSLQGLWAKQSTIADNLANVDTPGYQAQRLDFDQYMRDALQNGRAGSPAEYVSRVSAPLRTDANTVDLDGEMVLMTKNSARYQSVMSQVGRKLNLLNSVIRDS